MLGNKNDFLRTGGNGRRCVSIAHNGLLWISGITTVDISADVREQTKDVFSQLDKLLAAGGSDKHHILKADITLADMNDYGHFNAEWDLWVDDGLEPCRNVTGGALALPEYRVKVSLVAAIF